MDMIDHLKGNREDGSQVNFNFILTEECNWCCDYCYFSDMDIPKSVTMESLKAHLEYIKDFNIKGYMDVQWGEIGLVDVGLLEYFFETMGRKMYISTNGVFLNKKIHLNEKIRPYIKMIQWHVYPNPHGDVQIENIKDSGIVITRGIVHDNMDEMIDFINANKHIYFEYVDFDYPLDSVIVHDRQKYMEFYQKLNHLENISEGAKNRIRERAQESDELRQLCMEKNDSILIDLVNERICLCQRNMHIHEELGLFNLYRRCWTDPAEFFDLNGNVCESCGRLYEGKTRNLECV